MAAAVAELNFLRKKAGRDGSPFAINDMAVYYVGEPGWETGRFCLAGPAERIAEHLVGRAAIGVTHIQLRLRSRDVGELCDQIAAFGQAVAPLVEAA
jgi:hypothetical protein